MSERFKKLMKGKLGVIIWMLVLSGPVIVGLNFILNREKSEVKPQKICFSEKPGLNLAKVSLPFIPNEGQWDSQIKFRADLFSGAFFITGNELVYSLVKADEKDNAVKAKTVLETDSSDFGTPDNRFRQVTFKETFLSNDGKAITFFPQGEEKAITRVAYFKGNGAELWRSHLSSYNSVSLGGIYPGVEVRLRASARNVEKLFYLKPGTRVEDIRIRVDGIKSIDISPEGELVLKTEIGNLAMMKPLAYQEIDGQKEYVEVAYELKGQNEYGFKILEPYNPEATLVIDPALSTLSASTFIGGKGNDRGFCIALDNAGNVYVAGYTLSSSSDYPTTSGAYDTTYNGGYDVFVSKLSSSLDSLEASTYIGGKGTDYLYSLVLDSFENVYLVGITNSSDFPTTPGAYHQSYNGGDYDAFIVKLSPDLSSLLASTYFGGSGVDYGVAIALDNSWNLYITGMTSSSNFPITSGAFDTSYGGRYDVFVAKLSNSLDSLLASTFIGGSDYEIGSSIVVDNSGNVYIGGRTKSSNFPTTSGAYDTTYNGDYDVFISKLNGSLDSLLASTYIGGSGPDYGYPIAVDNSGNVYVTGYTLSSDYPTTEGAYDTSHNGSYDVFISRLSGTLGTLLASTYFGGTDDDRSRSIALDVYGNVYIAGWTKSTDFPNTSGAYDRSQNGSWDVFVSKLSANLSTVFSSTFVGGVSDDLAYALAVDGSGNVYVTGYTLSSGFPTTEGIYDKTIDGTDVFVLKFSAVNQYLLTVNRSGNGSGKVTSADGGINCGTDCSQIYDNGTVVKLTATPDADSVFAGWSGDAVSADNPLTLTVNSDKNITAKFVPKDLNFTLTVIKSGPGNGTVTSEDGGINCGSDCSEIYPAGTVVKLTAIPDENSGFDSWTGDISGTNPTISVAMDSDKTVIAVFGPTPLPDLTGQWHDFQVFKFTGRTTILRAFLRLSNIGEAEATNGFKISYYLSADGQSLDTLLNSRTITLNLTAGSSREILFARYVPSSISIAGKYLIAVIDSEEKVIEKDETNNKIVFGPLQ